MYTGGGVQTRQLNAVSNRREATEQNRPQAYRWQFIA